MSVNPRNAHVESFIDTIQDLFLFQHIQQGCRKQILIGQAKSACTMI